MGEKEWERIIEPLLSTSLFSNNTSGIIFYILFYIVIEVRLVEILL